MFKNAQIGDRVWDLRYECGTITFIDPSKTYPIKVIFDFRLTNKNYTFDGRSSLDFISPTLFWNKFKIPPEAFIKPQPKLEKDTKVLVWNEKGCFNESRKHKRYFSYFDKDGRICCYEQGCTSWSATTTQTWDNWELYEK